MMLELNRLKPMPDSYDKELFNSLYLKTHNLRRKLASQIDARRFGVGYEDILSTFDIKFIFVFSQHHEKPENILLGFILNSLQNFKCRILRSAYTQKFSQSILSVDNILNFDDHLSEQHPENMGEENYYEHFMEFMRNHISLNAYTVLDLKLNPPPYIYNKLNVSPDSNLRKVPDHIILDYLDLGTGPKAFKYLSSLKKEIKNAVNHAKEHFSKN
jgi:hypothetical protein